MPMPLHHGTNDDIASAHVASSFAHAALVLFLKDCTWHELIMQKID